MMRFWPRSLANRTALVVLLGLVVVQAAGLGIHALDRVDLQKFAQSRLIAERMRTLIRTTLATAPEDRADAIADMSLPTGMTASVDDIPAARDASPLPSQLRAMLGIDNWGAMRWRRQRDHHERHGRREGRHDGDRDRHRDDRHDDRHEGRRRPPDAPAYLEGQDYFVAALSPDERDHGFLISIRLPEGTWLNIRAELSPPRPWHSPKLMLAFLLMTAAAAALSLWAARRLTRPLRTLAQAADALGRDVNAKPLPENGPTELAKAAVAFNTMAARIRNFVKDRTDMLAAIGHDLRTPITRLRLRAEFMDDDEQRDKMLADLAEMEAMISATLAFARDDATTERARALDLAALLRTILDDAADASTLPAERITYRGPEHLVVKVRPIALKRALTNLIANALNYGGAAYVTLHAPAGGVVRIDIDDEGPGLPADQIERMFMPFQRMESSRNRETGGTGLGLPITRNILRAHGGDVVLSNRAEGGLRAMVTLPA